MRKTLIACAALIAGASAASAADVYRPSTKDTGHALTLPSVGIAEVTYFKGGYVGIEGGLGAAVNEFKAEEAGEVLTGYNEETEAPIYAPYKVGGVLDGGGADLGLVGLNAGWNFRFGNFVIGPSFYYDWMTGSTDAELYNVFNGERNSVGASFEYLSQWGAGGRVGLVVFDSAMIYGGLYYTRLDTEASVHAGGETLGIKGQTFDGWQGVAGIEAMVSDHVGIKLEGSYSNFGSETLHREETETGVLSVTSQPAIYAIKGGLNYHF